MLRTHSETNESKICPASPNSNVVEYLRIQQVKVMLFKIISTNQQTRMEKYNCNLKEIFLRM